MGMQARSVYPNFVIKFRLMIFIVDNVCFFLHLRRFTQKRDVMYLSKIGLAVVLLQLSVFAASEVWTGKVAKEFASGAGKSNDPFVIETPEQFALMAEKYDSTFYYKLASDIVLNKGSAKDWAKSAPKNKWTVYGDTLKPALIYLDGAGHSISGLYISSDENFQGLFGVWKGSVTNLEIRNSYVKGGASVGALAGTFYGYEQNTPKDPNVQNISADVIVKGTRNVGGLFGTIGFVWMDSVYAYPNVLTFSPMFLGAPYLRDISVSGVVDGDSVVGGVIGMTGVSYIHATYRGIVNRASVMGRKYVGGLLGFLYIDVPKDYGIFRDIVNEADIAGEEYVGGLIGLVYGGRDEDRIFFQNVVNLGDVSGKICVGGLLVFHRHSEEIIYYEFNIGNGYNAGKVSGDSLVGALFPIAPKLLDRLNLSILHLYDLNGEHADSVHFYADSMGAHFFPDSGTALVNRGYPLLAYYNMDKLFDYGSGTKENPYLIKSLGDLRRFERHAAIVIDSTLELRYFRQDADIELPKAVNNWTPVDGWAISYDGNGHSISNLNIHQDVNVDSLFDEPEDDVMFYYNVTNKNALPPIGFFSNLSRSEIRSLTLHKVDIVGEKSVGALWSGQGNFNDISNITVDGSVSGVTAVCGVAPYMSGTMFNVTNYADVKGIRNICGVTSGDVFYARNYGNVTGKSSVGGISFSLYSNDIKYVYNRGTVSGDRIVGGLVAGTVGGVGKLSHGYNASVVTGDEYVGAIIGKPQKKDTIHGPLFYDNSLTSVPALGFDTLVVFDSIAGMDSKTLKSRSSIQKLGGYFNEDSHGENGGYPILAFLEGQGSESDPYIIDSPEKLWLLSLFSNGTNHYGNTVMSSFFCDKNFKVTADIDLNATSEYPWIPLFSLSEKTDKFVGIFDGGGHVISGIYTDSVKNSGLFALNSGTIKNVGIAKSTIRGTNAGAIAGTNHGIIENCWNESASIEGVVAGGIVGVLEADSINRVPSTRGTSKEATRKIYLDRTYNAGTVYGSANAGGLVGYAGMSLDVYWAEIMESPENFISVVNSYNVGKVKSDTGSVAGLVSGFKDMSVQFRRVMFTLKNLYNTANVCVSELKKCSPTALTYPGQVYVKNVFYLGSPDSSVVGVAKSSKEMKSRSFAPLLEEAFEYDSKGVNGGFPIFSGKGTFDPNELDKGQAGIEKMPLVFRALRVSVVGRTIHLDNLVEGGRTALFDMRGKCLWLGAPGVSKVAIPVQKAGIYIVRNKFQVEKIIVR